ncbi:MAG: hypothetical protein H6Q47_260 [Deltaproteobacteria bacterium]|nr:hypothetical protein [Deltaproteobacteria bacterium]
MSDQDDYWHDNKLSVLLSHFDEKTILVYSDMNIVDEKGAIVHPTYWTTRKNNFTELDLLIIANTITGAASIFRKELLNFLLPFPEKIGDSYHDNFIACAALSLGDIRYEGTSLYDYRQHSENVFGHKVPPIINKKECFLNFLGKITNINSGFAKSFQQTLINYQTVYYNDFIRRILIAHVLNLRCYTSSEEKKKTIKRFTNFERGLYGIVFEVIKNIILKKGSVTVGNDTQLLKSVLSVRLLNKYNSFLKIFAD